MKAIYVFFCCISLLLAVGCSNLGSFDEVEVLEEVPVINPGQESAFHKLSWPLTLDSFNTQFTRLQPGMFTAKSTPANKLSLTRDKDSITLSGAFHLAYHDKQRRLAYHSYHFYVKAGLQSLETFFKTDQFVNEVDDHGKGLQKVAVAEKGYHLGWARKA